MKRIIAFLFITLVLPSGCVTYHFFKDVHGKHKNVEYENFTIKIGIVSSSESGKSNYYYVGLIVLDNLQKDDKQDSLIIDSVCVEVLGDDYKICPITMQKSPNLQAFSSWNVFMPDNNDSIMISFSIAIYNLNLKKIVKRDRVSEKLYRSNFRDFVR